MKSFTMQMDTENAVFADDPAAEIARILRKLADRIESAGNSDTGGRLLDANGNAVGTWEIE